MLFPFGKKSGAVSKSDALIYKKERKTITVTLLFMKTKPLETGIHT